MKILSFGEVLWDVFPDAEYLGGAPLNVAAHVARHGGDAYMVSAVGNDERGMRALRHMQTWGVYTDYIKTVSAYPTGACFVRLDEKSVPTYELATETAWDHIEFDATIRKPFDVLYFGTLALRSKENMETLATILHCHSFKHVFVDVNLRAPFYSKETVSFALNNATILKISEEELSSVLSVVEETPKESIADTWRSLSKRYTNLRQILLTCGENGAYVYDVTSDRLYKTDAVNTSVVSTVGAGDSFSAAYLYRFINDADIQHSLDYASKVAAYVVSKSEAVPPYNIEMFI